MTHVSRALAQKGWRVHVLTENRTDAPTTETLEPNLDVRRLSPMNPGRWWRWKEFARVAWWHHAIRHWSRRGPLWATDPLMAAAAILAGRGQDLIFNPAACVAAMRRVGQLHPHAVTMQRPRKLAWLDRWAARRARRIVVGSANLKNQFQTFYQPLRAEIHVVPHGVAAPTTNPDPTQTRAQARARWPIAPDAFVVGFVGRLDPCKGLDFLFQALAHTPAPQRTNTRLLIVGDGPDRARLTALAQGLGLSNLITWTGRLDDPTPAYAAMDLFVLPSIYEAFGNVILEAMAHGLPVIARAGDGQSSFTAADELVTPGRDGFVADPHDPFDLERKIQLLADNPTQRQYMSHHARRTAARLSWDTTTEQYLQIIHPAQQPLTHRRAA